jgi:hypothetical protein
MLKKTINVTAQVQIVSADKKKALTAIEQFEFTTSIMDGVPYPEDVLKQVCMVEAQDKFVDVVRARLVKDVGLKKLFGSTKWVVAVLDTEINKEANEACPQGADLGQLLAWRFKRDEALAKETNPEKKE